MKIRQKIYRCQCCSKTKAPSECEFYVVTERKYNFTTLIYCKKGFCADITFVAWGRFRVTKKYYDRYIELSNLL